MASKGPSVDALRHLIRTHPLIDNHAHNILAQEHACNYRKYPFESITSEAQGLALDNAVNTLPLIRAANQLSELYGCSPDWDDVKAARGQWVQRDYQGLVSRCLDGTHALLLDDLLTDHDIEPYGWHDQFTVSATKRIVRIEVAASKMLMRFVHANRNIRHEISDFRICRDVFKSFQEQFEDLIHQSVADPDVAGFKSVICYRTGLSIEEHGTDAVVHSLRRTMQQGAGFCIVDDKPLNDWLVLRTLNILQYAKRCDFSRPLQLHTGLGDSDMSLLLSNPAHLQPVVAGYPEVDFVLLHSSYPYTREAGYLACVYPNAYLDLGEVFPMVSRDAEESIIRESLEITPTNRLLWSTDGHFFPETYWLSNQQFRQTLETVCYTCMFYGDDANPEGFCGLCRQGGLHREPGHESSSGYTVPQLQPTLQA